MKIGELKLSTLMLTVPSLEISFDSESDDNIRETIMDLKENPNISDYIPLLPSAINRAISIIERRGGSPARLMRVDSFNFEKIKNGYRITLDKLKKDILSITKIMINGHECAFEVESANTIILHSEKVGEYELLYKPRLARITEATSDFYELEIDEALLELIPYFAKSELILSEYPDEAKSSREHFFELLDEFLGREREYGVKFDTVFSLE
ncbi:MAG: hypothetical protein IJ437_01680 [Clostridia bacterium]|nr:hypothetical protein [Clostridia bacterium]